MRPLNHIAPDAAQNSAVFVFGAAVRPWHVRVSWWWWRPVELTDSFVVHQTAEDGKPILTSRLVYSTKIYFRSRLITNPPYPPPPTPQLNSSILKCCARYHRYWNVNSTRSHWSERILINNHEPKVKFTVRFSGVERSTETLN